MHDQTDNHDKSRRQIVKKIIIGTGTLYCFSMLPERWTKPVIGQIVIPAHAQTSGPLICGCQLAGLVVNSAAGLQGEFSAFYSWQCLNAAETRLMISGAGTTGTLGYVEPNFSAGTSGSRTFTNVVPYDATDFVAGETYTFTLTVEDINGNVLETCIDTVVAI